MRRRWLWWTTTFIYVWEICLLSLVIFVLVHHGFILLLLICLICIISYIFLACSTCSVYRLLSFTSIFDNEWVLFLPLCRWWHIILTFSANFTSHRFLFLFIFLILITVIISYCVLSSRRPLNWTCWFHLYTLFFNCLRLLCWWWWRRWDFDCWGWFFITVCEECGHRVICWGLLFLYEDYLSHFYALG